jgi:hypothetical protein
MPRRSAFRAALGAAVAVAIVGGLTLVAFPVGEPVPVAPPPAAPDRSGQPLGAITPALPPVDRVDPNRTQAVTDLLRRRADAVLRRDEAAFLATVDPTADREFADAQRALFANLAGVPFDEWAYVLHPDDTVDLTMMPASPGTDELWAPAVDLRYALHGADPVPTSRGMGYLFARRGDTWYLRSDTALDELGRRTWRGPWDFGPSLVITTGRGIVLAHPGSEPVAQRLAGELDASVDAVSALWGTGWSQRVALLLPDTPDEMKALVGPGFPVESVVAVAVADRVDADRGTVAGQRVVFSPTGSRTLSVASLRVVLRHEILHVAARADTVDGSPMWLLEGFADYVGYRDSGITLPQGAPDLVELVRREGPPAALPVDAAFRSQGRDLDLAYQQAWSVARFVADRHGEDRLVALYRRLAGAGPASAGDTDAILREVLGTDRGGLIAGWRQYLRDTIG